MEFVDPHLLELVKKDSNGREGEETSDPLEVSKDAAPLDDVENKLFAFLYDNTELFKCDECSFSTHFKTYLEQHKLGTHCKNLPNIFIYCLRSWTSDEVRGLCLGVERKLYLEMSNYMSKIVQKGVKESNTF
jgi:hypothetical protein